MSDSVASFSCTFACLPPNHPPWRIDTTVSSPGRGGFTAACYHPAGNLAAAMPVRDEAALKALNPTEGSCRLVANGHTKVARFVANEMCCHSDHLDHEIVRYIQLESF